MVTAAVAALGLHIPHHHSPSPRSEKEVTSAFQEPPGLPLLYVLILQQVIGVAEVPHEDEDL